LRTFFSTKIKINKQEKRKEKGLFVLKFAFRYFLSLHPHRNVFPVPVHILNPRFCSGNKKKLKL